MKKVALMQPYLFPYLGYFQMINAVDTFIAYDDVQWMKGGWINRNRILVDGKPQYITLPIKKDSFTKNINERVLLESIEVEKQNILTSIKEQYSDAPYFNEAYGVIERCFANKEMNAANFIVDALKTCANYLGITTEILLSSDIEDKNIGLRAQDRVLDIISRVGAEEYINAIGGQGLYDRDVFAMHGIQLYFIKMGDISYRQFNESFVPGLSIIDIMMFNSQSEIKEMLNNYELI